MTDARKEEIRKLLGLQDPPPPYVPMSRALIDDAFKRANREAWIGAGVGAAGATAAALVLLATGVQGVVVALGTMVIGQAVGLLWVHLRFRSKGNA